MSAARSSATVILASDPGRTVGPSSQSVDLDASISHLPPPAGCSIRLSDKRMTEEGAMAAVNVRELARNTSKVIDDVERLKRPAIITRSGRPVAAVVPIDSEALEDWILANAPEFVEGMRKADEELRRGETISMEECFAARKRRDAKRRKATSSSRRAAMRRR